MGNETNSMISGKLQPNLLSDYTETFYKNSSYKNPEAQKGHK